MLCLLISLYAGNAIIIWNNFYILNKLLYLCYGQSAGNCNSDESLLRSSESNLVTGTSETSREKLPEKLKHVKHVTPESNHVWGSYLAGLYEGDGYISDIPQVVITFHQNDLAQVQKLRDKFGHGTVKTIAGKNAVNWVISNRDGIIKFVNLINGHLRMQRKIDQINSHLPESYKKDPQLTFNQTTASTSSLLDSWWLVGFADADGCFYIQIVEARVVQEKGRTRVRNTEVRLNFKVSCKDKEILDQLSCTFGSSVGKRVQKSNGKITYYWSSTSFAGAEKVDKYFINHTLQTSKWLNYLMWRSAYLILKSGKINTPEGLEKIRSLKSKMNSNLDVTEF